MAIELPPLFDFAVIRLPAAHFYVEVRSASAAVDRALERDL
ncbi:MAG: hypothetical protein WBE91_01830 [Steroidobacteraceae bacterium]